MELGVLHPHGPWSEWVVTAGTLNSLGLLLMGV
jgi:hypothetical protein